MADDEGRRAGRVNELPEQLVDDGRVGCIELAGGLVGEQEARPVRDRSTDRYALLLAAGEVRRRLAGPVE